MLTHEHVSSILRPWVKQHAEGLAQLLLEKTIYLGKPVYVVTQYFSNKPFEVIEATVTTMRFDPRKDKKYFTVEGKWHNGNYYNATFQLSSMNKKIFSCRSSAEYNATIKNNRRNNDG